MELSVEEFREICTDVFRSNGFSEEEAELTADEIVEAEAMGKKSHGASIVPEIAGWESAGEPETVKENSVSAFVKGNGKIGSVVARDAMDLAVEKSESNGVGIVGVNNEYPFITAGYNPWRAAEEEVIGINWSAASSKVALHGGSDSVIGTNPLGVGIPGGEFPIVLDMAITRAAAADIRRAERLGEGIDRGLAISADGEPTTDPQEAIDGSMLPFGGYKGSGLGVIIELLGGAFVGGKTGTSVSGDRGMVFLAMQPDLFVSRDKFLERVESFVSEVEGIEPREGFEDVRLPGERAYRSYRESMEKGLELEDRIYSQLEELR